jgi:hypothetical protein
MRYLLCALLLIGSAAQSAPLPNLALSCPDENAINQVALDACRGYVYQIPTNERIVVSPSLSSYFWRSAADLAASELVQVCTIPVEPGAYSSCRDAAGNRRTAFVRKDSIISGGRNSVTVSKGGGDYTDPVTAAKNAFSGDTWCVAPQWPLQPCVMAIGDGVFILRETLTILEGLAVSGNGKGDTMLVADNGVETAISSLGNIRFSDLTIVNSQPGRARTTGLNIRRPGPGAVLQLDNVAIHVSGAAQNVAVVRGGSVEILDSEITAVGQDTAGISAIPPPDLGTRVTLERSRVSAALALNDEQAAPGVVMRLVDAQIFGNIRFDAEGSPLEIVGSQIVGNVTATNDAVRVTIADSSIKGSVGAKYSLGITNTSVDGGIGVSQGGATVDGLTLHGRFSVGEPAFGGFATVVRSYISTESAAAAFSLTYGSVQLEQTFVQGALAVAVDARSRLQATSSVLAGPVSGSAGAVISCTDTYGADYELLNASCQPQVP